MESHVVRDLRAFVLEPRVQNHNAIQPCDLDIQNVTVLEPVHLMTPIVLTADFRFGGSSVPTALRILGQMIAAVGAPAVEVGEEMVDDDEHQYPYASVAAEVGVVDAIQSSGVGFLDAAVVGSAAVATCLEIGDV